MNVELFEVKSGDNIGVYLKVTNLIPEEMQRELLGKDGLGAGIISVNHRLNFYKRHGAATNKSLQSMDTFKQVATIWRLNSYGTDNEYTIKHKGERINQIIDIFKTYIPATKEDTTMLDTELLLIKHEMDNKPRKMVLNEAFIEALQLAESRASDIEKQEYALFEYLSEFPEFVANISEEYKHRVTKSWGYEITK